MEERLSVMKNTINNDVNTYSIKLLEQHRSGYFTEKFLYCAGGSREPITDENGSYRIKTVVDAGIVRSLLMLLLLQWMFFGSVVLSYVVGLRMGAINFFVTLLAVLLVSVSRKVFFEKALSTSTQEELISLTEH
ncbi:MAG: hypothetical protein D6B27_12460 [Gammaproteobacteria bacterium]|mgnify:CR=1 FL=1|nr:MAG: hypothetical protein D6B27_12460 [Gammaproteobacteria bacterium]